MLRRYCLFHPVLHHLYFGTKLPIRGQVFAGIVVYFENSKGSQLLNKGVLREKIPDRRERGTDPACASHLLALPKQMRNAGRIATRFFAIFGIVKKRCPTGLPAFGHLHRLLVRVAAAPELAKRTGSDDTRWSRPRFPGPARPG